jgi:two-component system sensor histidine kinase MtrB
MRRVRRVAAAVAGALPLRSPARYRAGLRWRATAAFALGGLVTSAVFATATYVVARGYLLDQRETSALRQAYADASFVRDGLLTARVPPGDVIGDVQPRTGSHVIVRVGGGWFAGDLTDTRSELPPALVDTVAGGESAVAWVRVGGEPAIAVGTPLPAVGAQFYEVSTVSELDRTLRVLRTVLVVVGVVTALGAAVVGRSAARRVVRPLDDVAGAAAAIAAGRLDTRLPPTDDPDLAGIVGSFNAMVDAVESRIDRETRFTADVSHELRSPLTTLVTGVELLSARRDELPERSQRALDLVRGELDRFRRTLDDLLELARLDAGDAADAGLRADTDVDAFLRHVVRESGRDVPVDAADGAGPAGAGGTAATVNVDRRQVERALLNLLENADRYGGGATVVGWWPQGDHVVVHVDDAGPGVPPEDRERIFARFARGDASRGSTRGTGLGLSLVAETAQRHGGAAWCEESPAGGARFAVRLPVTTGAGDGDPAAPLAPSHGSRVTEGQR